jgi:hypothetical protein
MPFSVRLPGQDADTWFPTKPIAERICRAMGKPELVKDIKHEPDNCWDAPCKTCGKKIFLPYPPDLSRMSFECGCKWR